MNLIKVKCAFCKKEFFREKGRYNEAKKFGWNQYCSKKCQDKAKITKVEKVCGNPNCNNKISRKLNQFKRSKSGLIFCSRSCAAITNNKKYPKRKAKMGTCIQCGKSFKKRGRLKYCSIKCRRETEYTPEKLLGIIRNAVQELGRVPAKRELEEIDKACRNFFGSWNSAIIAAGFKPNRSHSQRMYRRTRTRALDGHLCDSISEALVDNWLAKNNISHERDVSYPKTNHKADWAIFVGGRQVFIEYFGLANDSPRYDRAVRRKKELCRKHKLTLVAIYPQDIYPKKYLDNKLKDKFKNLINF